MYTIKSCAFFTALLSTMALGQGTVSGALTTQAKSGAPLVGATVVLNSTPAASLPPRVRLAVTDNRGSFKFNDVEPGSYTMCIHTIEALLTPCEALKAIDIVVSDSERRVDLSLPSGRRVMIVLDDPDWRLRRSKGGDFMPGRARAVLKLSGQPEVAMPLTAVGHAQIFFSMVFPVGVSGHLEISAPGRLLSNGKDNPQEKIVSVLSPMIDDENTTTLKYQVR